MFALSATNSPSHVQSFRAAHQTLQNRLPAKPEIGKPEEESYSNDSQQERDTQVEQSTRRYIAEYGLKCIRRVLKNLFTAFSPGEHLSKFVEVHHKRLIEIIIVNDISQVTVRGM